MNETTMRAISVITHHKDVGFKDDCPSIAYAGAFYIECGVASRRTFDIWFDSIMLDEELSRTNEHDMMIWKDYRELVMTIGTSMVLLDSVGSFLNVGDNCIYPADAHGRPDTSKGSAIDLAHIERDGEWFEKLNNHDKLMVTMHIESVEDATGNDFYTNQPK
jgi:hypothetical protein